MIDLLTYYIGEYIVPEFYDTTSAQIIIPSGMAGVDWRWVMSAVLLIVMVYSVFKLLASMVNKI